VKLLILVFSIAIFLVSCGKDNKTSSNSSETQQDTPVTEQVVEGDGVFSDDDYSFIRGESYFLKGLTGFSPIDRYDAEDLLRDSSRKLNRIRRGYEVKSIEYSSLLQYDGTSGENIECQYVSQKRRVIVGIQGDIVRVYEKDEKRVLSGSDAQCSVYVVNTENVKIHSIQNDFTLKFNSFRNLKNPSYSYKEENGHRYLALQYDNSLGYRDQVRTQLIIDLDESLFSAYKFVKINDRNNKIRSHLKINSSLKRIDNIDTFDWRHLGELSNPTRPWQKRLKSRESWDTTWQYQYHWGQ